MKRRFIIVLGIMMAVFAHSQTVQTWTENFDGAVSFTASPSGSWVSDVAYYVLDPSISNPKSYLGLVASTPGNITTLETDIYDCTSYNYILLRFSQICKISPQDSVWIEYRIGMGAGMGSWNPIPGFCYRGKASNFRTRSFFNAASYPEWQANDSIALPSLSQSWWKEEIFDLEWLLGYEVQFRFVIVHGQQAGTHASYGWLIDNFELTAATYPLYPPPMVEFIAPLVKDTVFNTGPWEIKAKVKTQTNISILNPYLKYKATLNGALVKEDSVLMDNIEGDSLWKASIPQFMVGTKVVYSITGKDTTGIYTTVASQYDIIRDCQQGGGGKSNNCVDNPYSALAYSIDMPEITVISPTTTTLPIIASVKNIGSLDMDSVTVWYSINGSAPVSTTWIFNQALTWDMNYQGTAGTYPPKVGSFDTIMVWVKNPNGQTDPLINDDTITKVIYIGGDIQVEFISKVTDTLYKIGPHKIKAKIVSVTGAPLPPVRLYISSTYQNKTTYDTLDMTLDISDSLWKGSIPQYRFGSDVVYAIKLRDTWQNDLVWSDGYYIKRSSCTTIEGIMGDATFFQEFFYTGGVQTISLPEGTYQIETWGADGAEGAYITGGGLPPQIAGGKGGYSVGRIDITSPTTLYIVVGGKGTNNGSPSSPGGYNGGGACGSGANVSPTVTQGVGGGGGATHVALLPGLLSGLEWNKSAVMIVAGGGGGGGNLSIGGHGGGLNGVRPAANTQYYNNIAGGGGTQYAAGISARGGSGAGFGQGGTTIESYAGGGGGGWYGGGTGASVTGGGGGSGYIGGVTAGICADASQAPFVINPITDGNGYVRITSTMLPGDIDTLICLDHSVELKSINSPDAASAISGISMPVHVSICNRGIEKLDSCYINWSLNGVVQPNTIVYKGKEMWENFTDTITIGEYTPGMYQRDVITVWVSMPNGQADAYTGDDSLTTSPLGCPNMGNTTKNIPNDFATIDDVIYSILNCGINGKLILEFEPNTYTGIVDLTPLKNVFTVSDTLVIRSTTGSASDVIFTPASGDPALRINSIRNLYIEHITLNAAAGTHGVEIVEHCDNVEINSCIINARIGARGSFADGCGIYYLGTTTSPALGNIRILNNYINNGDAGIYFYYPNQSNAAQSTSFIRITGNTIEKSWYYGIYSYNYGHFDSIAYNVINPNAAITMNQSGIYLWSYTRVDVGIIGNKINIGTWYTSNGIEITNQMNTASTGATGPALIANNEIRRIPTVTNSLARYSTFSGFYHFYVVANYLHNSVYAEGEGIIYGMNISASNSSSPCTIMNNIFVCAGSGTDNYALYSRNTQYATPTYGVTLDYNNYYSTGPNLSNLGTTLQLLQQATRQDINSINIKPEFIDVSNSLELKNSDSLLVSRVPLVSKDINGLLRSSTTAMGAYECPPTKRDLMLIQFASSWEQELVKGQTVAVNVEGQNLGTYITEATFGWSVNGVNQTPSMWTPTTTFAPFTQQTIPVGSFVATGADTFRVVVWVETVNGQSDEESGNDTVSAITIIAPLAEFVAPFVNDTIGSLSFDVYIKIREGSGADVNIHKMYIETFMDGNNSCYKHIYDSVTIVRKGDKWVANIPKQYYGSKVIYETHISDTTTPGNTITLRDSTYIIGGGTGKNTDYVYTGQVDTISLPYGKYQIEVWGASGGDGVNATYLGGNGGKGGYSTGVLDLSSTTTFYLVVGERGKNSLSGIGNGFGGDGGFGAGGGGGSSYMNGNSSGGGGGGGLSGLFIDSVRHSKSIIIAGGGGGGGGAGSLGAYANEREGTTGGHGGGIDGQDGSSTLTGNGIPFIAGTNKFSNYPGSGGTPYNGGTSGYTTTAIGGEFFGGAGVGYDVGSAGDGITLSGGAGAKTMNTAAYGGGSGGGGGGYYGGGGGDKYGMGGGGGSGYIHTIISNGITTDASQLDFVPNPDASGNGYIRITYLNSEAYTMGNNLGIFKLISPKNVNDGSCVNFSSPVEIELSNLGENDYDFTKDSIVIGYEISSPQRVTTYNGNISINTGSLLSGNRKTIEILSALAIVPGSYAIKAWVISPLDNYSCDDTLDVVYVSDLMGLPIDEDFSGNVLSPDFASTAIIGTEIWRPYSDTSTLSPPSGNGMLCYAGSYGSIAILSTVHQFNLNGAVDPELKFWYYHDPSLPATDWSYTNVNIIADGVKSLDLTLFKRDTVQGWKQYTVDLKKYINKCVFIEFESMNRSELQLSQYIGRLTITTTPDLAVSSIIITPEAAVCALTNKDLKVVLRTSGNQAVDFSNTNNSLAIQVGSQAVINYPLTGSMAGNISDTVLVASQVDLTGVTEIKVWLTSSVDNYPSNDTATVKIDINPSLSINVISLTGGVDCFRAGIPVHQQIQLKNTGNVNLSGIKLMLRITGDHTTTFINEIGSIDLQAGEDSLYTFTNTYIVPDEASYQIVVTAYLGCDSARVRALNVTNECADLNNLILSDGDLGGSTDTIGSTKTLTVTVENKSETKTYTAIPVTAVIEDKDRQVIEMWMDIIPVVNYQSTLPFSFTKKYTVPDGSIYYITVYLSNMDVYPEDDTVTITRNAIDTVPGTAITSIKATNSFTLGQNIPNPANNSTRIDYNIPEAGKVIFHLRTVIGQLLYSKTLEATSGANSIELDISAFAAGTYIYSIEYNTQKISKQLIINKE
jgi:hypothetical protein